MGLKGPSYCAVHDVFPKKGEPCWECVDPRIEEAVKKALELERQRMAEVIKSEWDKFASDFQNTLWEGTL